MTLGWVVGGEKTPRWAAGGIDFPPPLGMFVTGTAPLGTVRRQPTRMSVRAVPAIRSTNAYIQHTGRERRSAIQAPQAGNIPRNDQSQRLGRGIFLAPTNRAGFAHRSAQPLVKCQAKGFGGDDAGKIK
jgi:hypothetical protein